MANFSSYKADLIAAASQNSDDPIKGGLTVSAQASELDLNGSGVSVGDLRFVSETNRLYLWNGSGWYNVALVNQTPTITAGGAGTYEFEQDGTPVVITLTANDPEGFPLTWGYQVTEGTLGNTATVTQNENEFTITPTTNTDYEGSFTLSFTVTDGINIAYDVNSFNLKFIYSFEPATLSLTNAQVLSGTSSGDTPYMSDDGLHLYVVGNGSYQHWLLTTPYDFDTATLVHTLTGSTAPFGGQDVQGIAFDPTGTKLIAWAQNQYIYQYSCSTPWDISSGVQTASKGLSGGAGDNNKGAGACMWFDDGNVLVCWSRSRCSLLKISCTTPYDITGSPNNVGGYLRDYNAGGANSGSAGFISSSDGLQIDIMGGQYNASSNKGARINLTDPWNSGSISGGSTIWTMPNGAAAGGTYGGISHDRRLRYLFVQSGGSVIKYEMVYS